MYTLQILFLGCGDLRNALNTVAHNKKQKLYIHLNDWNPSIIARNVLMLKVISAPDFDTNNEDDVAFLWDLWYNAEWAEVTLKKFKSVLKELLDNVLPENVVIAKSEYLQSLQSVWRSWHYYCSKIKSEAELLMDKMHKERCD
jgi:DNA-binding transcriptional regulator PaaX